MTKIDIISGFLGAGKTTLIKKLLQDAFKGQQIVLIENEFGEIGIDGGFLKDAGIEIREMNSGCICCSLVGDFGTALKEVTEKYTPDRIIIEPSGVGKLSDVIHAVEKLDAEVVLNSAITVVDVLKCKMYLKNFGEFFKNQVAAAGTIILSRTDTEKADSEKMETAISLIRDINPKATIITTPIEQLGGQKILDTIEGKKIELSNAEEEHEHEHHHEHAHHHANEVFTSWGRETVRKYTSDEIKEILKTLSDDASYGTILRAKGMLEDGDGKWTYFDMVPGEFEVRSGSAEYTGRICVIGSKIDEEKLEQLWFGR